MPGGSDIQDWFKSLPIFTRYWLVLTFFLLICWHFFFRFGLTVLFTLLGRFSLLNPQWLILSWETFITKYVLLVHNPLVGYSHWPDKANVNKKNPDMKTVFISWCYRLATMTRGSKEMGWTSSINLLYSSFHVWRPVTCLFFYPLSPKTGFHFLINLYFLYNYRCFFDLWSRLTDFDTQS